MTDMQTISEKLDQVESSTQDNGVAIAVIQSQVAGITEILKQRSVFVQILLGTAAGIGRLCFSNWFGQGLFTLLAVSLIGIGSLAGMSKFGFGVSEAIGNMDKVIDQMEKVKDLGDDESFVGPNNVYAGGITDG